MASNAEIEREYIRQELENHNKWLTELWGDKLVRRKLKREGKLMGSVARGSHSISGGDVMKLERGFLGYGRVLEIQHNRRKRGLRGMRAEAREVAWGVKKYRKGAKNTQWYTRTLFGAQNRLVTRLMYGLSDFKRKVIRGQLEADRKIKT